MKKVKAIILAAGRGTRMKSGLPKALHAIHSKPMLGHLISTVKRAGIKDIVLVLGHGIDEIKKLFPGFDAVRQKKQLGSGDAVNSARGYFRNYSGKIIILYADTPLLKEATLKRLIKTHQKNGAGCTLLTIDVDNPEGYGRIIRNDKNEIAEIVEEKDATPGEKAVKEINIGAYVFDKKTLFTHINEVKMNAKKKEYYLTDVVNILRESGIKVDSASAEDETESIGINSRPELALANRILQERAQKILMENGVTIVDPQTTHIDEGAKIAKDTIIYPNTVIEGNVEIGTGCKIGPFARIRPGTRIGRKVQIGNFVEIVRTKIGDNTKIKHLSYFGDAKVGKDVNVGAGVITANYDGKRKHKTVIEDKAAIGVGAILIAPVKIGKGAIVGAGSVVTKKKNVPPGKTVVGVPAKVMGKH